MLTLCIQSSFGHEPLSELHCTWETLQLLNNLLQTDFVYQHVLVNEYVFAYFACTLEVDASKPKYMWWWNLKRLLLVLSVRRWMREEMVFKFDKIKASWETFSIKTLVYIHPLLIWASWWCTLLSCRKTSQRLYWRQILNVSISESF